MLVTATEWGVSTTSSADGVFLDVYKIVERTPTPDNSLRCEVVYKIKHKQYPSADDARQAALEMGYLKHHDAT